MKATALALILTGLPAAAAAQALPLTVGEMREACRMMTGEGTATPEGAVAVGVCFGAARGVVQVMRANCRSYGHGLRPAAGLSVGEIPTSGEAIRAFIDWAEANPDEAEAPAEFGMITALATAFPCRPDAPVPSGSGGAAPSAGDDETPADSGAEAPAAGDTDGNAGGDAPAD